MDDEATRTRLVEEVRARAQSHRHPGTVVLICGAGRSDRELAAADLAARLGVALYRIDLARIVSKYIGETEKQLERVFNAAEHAGAVLFFDEADALFGRRAEVGETRAERSKTANRAWFLMTRRPGLCVLSVAAPAKFDPVLSGRIRYEVVARPHLGGAGTATMDAGVRRARLS
jgi:SpoVK/Ycf46/Vps4 family AAA+-type ATPase